MQRRLVFLVAAAMIVNSIAFGFGSVSAEQASVDIVASEDDNILRETGQTTVQSSSNSWIMADSKAEAESEVGDYIAGNENAPGFDYSSSTGFCGYKLNASTATTPSSVILKDPTGAYFKNLEFYSYYRNTAATDNCVISVSDSLTGTYTLVATVEKERVGNYNNTNTHSVWKYTVTDIEAKYIKITAPIISASGYPIIGAFSYDWLRITDLSQLPDGTNKFCGTFNQYWLADNINDVFNPFVEYSATSASVTATTTVTASDLAANKSIIGNPVNAGEKCFFGLQTAGTYAIAEAPENTFIRRVKVYIYMVGNSTSGLDTAISVSDKIDGTYTTAPASIKKLGYVSGCNTNHYLYEVETTDTLNCKYIKFTLPDNSYPKLGGFEYDYKINKTGVELAKIFYTLNDILDGQDRMHVEDNLKFFDSIALDEKEYDVSWTSGDASVVASDGTVTQPVNSKTLTVTATVSDENGAEVYSKDYEITVAAYGSTLVFRDDFETAEIDPETGIGKVTGYNSWTAAYPEGTKGGIVIDPADTSNKALWTHRDAESEDSDVNERKYNKISKGKVELTFKHKTTNKNTHSRFMWAGIDVYLQATYPYGSVNGVNAFEKSKSVVWKLNVWHEYRFVLDMDRSLMTIYYNGEPILENGALPEGSYNASDISFQTKRAGNYGSSYIDDVVVRNLEIPNEDAIEYDANHLNIPEETSKDITLPTEGDYGSIIAWESSDTGVIDNNGIVTQGAQDTDVVLRATLARGEITVERDVTVKVKGTSAEIDVTRSEDSIKAVAERFSLSKVLDTQTALNVTDNITLPTEYNEGDAGRLGGCSIRWSSDNTDVLNNDGKVTRGENDAKVTLTAEFSFNEASDIKAEKNYTLIISGEGEYEHCNTFDSAKFGDEASLLDKVSVAEANGSGVFYGAWQSPSDLLNGVLGVTRTDLTSIESESVLEIEYRGKNLEAGMSFYMNNASDRIDFRLNGLDILSYIKSSHISVDGVMYETKVTLKEWHKLVLRFDDYNKFCYVYLDGTLLSDSPIEYDAEFPIESIKISNSSSSGSIGSWYVDDVYIKNIDVTDEEAIRRTIEAIDIADTAEWNITLPKLGKLGASISWSSEDDSVLDGNGIVKRTVGGDKTITLTASVSRGDVVIDAEFDVVVPGLTGDETPTQEKFEEHVNAIDISELTSEKYTEITKDLNLFNEYMNGNSAFYGGMDVTWSSEHTKVITDDGKVTRPMLDKGVTMTATFTSKRDTTVTAQKDFHFIVLAPYELICYEDFDSITEDMVGTNIGNYKSWTFELQTDANKGMIAELEIDPADKEKPFNEANKAFRISRWRNSEEPERARWQFTPNERSAMLEGDAVIFSFNIKFINTSSQMDFELGNLGGVMKIGSINSNTVNGSYKAGKLSADEWHTMTFIVAPANGIVYFILDGENGFSVPYKNFTGKLNVTYLELHTFRQRGLSDYYIDDISIRVLKDSDADAVIAAASKLSVAENIEDTVELPAFGAERTNISWFSDDHNVILDNGQIVGTGSALLTAVIKRGTAQTEKEFAVNVTKTDGYDFKINGIIADGDVITGADILCTGSEQGGELVVLVYNGGRLVAIRSAEITGTTFSFNPVDISQFYDCDVKVYIKRDTDIVSNVFSAKLQ